MKNNIKQLMKNKKIFITAIIVFTIIAISLVTITYQVVRIVETRKMEQAPLLQYEIVDTKGEEVFEILITITSLDGIENITYKKVNSDDEITLYCKGRQKVAIDYEIYENVSYDFKIKQEGKNEVTETILNETPYIE